jgi:ketosteroid isomerase-like protein
MMGDFAVALNKGDVGELDKFYSDDYTLVDQDGAIQTKASRMEAIKSGKVKWEGLKFDDLKIKTNPTGDGAVVVGRASGKTIMDGKTEDRNSMVTWVVAKSRDKDWQFVSAQITDIKAGASKPSDDKKADDKASNSADDKKSDEEKP